MSQPAAAPPPAPKPAAPPKPEPVRAKEIASKVAAAFPAANVAWTREKRIKVCTTPEEVKALATFARDSLGFDHLSAVSGVDWIAKDQLEVVYFVASASKPGFEDFVFALSETLPRQNPVAPTLITVWPGAEMHERETHEMFGINFQGHPNLSHLLLPEDWNDLPPLRKDYASPGR